MQSLGVILKLLQTMKSFKVSLKMNIKKLKKIVKMRLGMQNIEMIMILQEMT